MARAVAIGGAAFALAMLVASLPVALAIGVAVAMWGIARGPRLSAVDAARMIEASGSLDNLLVTAAEIDARPRPVRAEIRDAIVDQAAERAQRVDAGHVVPLLQPIAVALAVLVGCVLLSRLAPQQAVSLRPALTGDSPGKGSGPFSVRVTPPAYVRRQVEEFASPQQISVIAGSRIHVEDAAGRVLRDWIALKSEGLEISPGPFFLGVTVVEDAAPSVRIVAPGKDTAFAEPAGQVAVGIQSGDDLGLASLSLRFTKASGGGESMSFAEGEVPLRLERRSDREWVGRADLSVAALGLADGDILVYRAIARDTNPNGAPVPSDQFLIEIGKNASIADAGFALPSEEKKYAISQQMVIYKTELLLAGSREPGAGTRKFTADEFMAESRGIAVEQRMVRAEVVFLGGGEVEDELEEAARSDELTEGRLQNSGRAEMLRAINAMSRAETLLNDGRAQEALVLEREALVHLERALDRRRYFLRTLPDRSRIDATRRLTGDRRDAQSWNRDPRSTAVAASLDLMRRVMGQLASGATIDASLAARVAAIDASAPELQKAAVALAAATTDAARQTVVREAMAAISRHAIASLPSSAAIDLREAALSGRLAEEARPRR